MAGFEDFSPFTTCSLLVITRFLFGPAFSCVIPRLKQLGHRPHDDWELEIVVTKTQNKQQREETASGN